MQTIAGKIYLTPNELNKAGVPGRNIYNRINANKEEVVYNASGRVMVCLDMLKQEHKEKVEAFFGKINLLGSVFDTFLRLTPADSKALTEWQHPDTGKKLSKNLLEKYLVAATWLNGIVTVTTGNKWWKKLGLERSEIFYSIIAERIKSENVFLPASRTRINLLVGKYTKHGATCLIANSVGAAQHHNAKLKGDALLCLIEFPSGPRKFNYQQLCDMLIEVAKERNWEKLKTITRQAVQASLDRPEIKQIWYAKRHGNNAFHNAYEQLVRQEKAKAPNEMWQIDGTPWDLWGYDPEYFGDKNAHKLYVVIVIDSHSNKVLGFGIGDTETSNLVWRALKMAVETTNNTPNYIKYDKGSALTAGDTQTLLNKLTDPKQHFATRTGRGRGKKIEAIISLIDRCILKFYENHSGGNITAKDINSAQNPDVWKRTKQGFTSDYWQGREVWLPNVAALILQIATSIAEYNEIKQKGDGLSPSEKYGINEVPLCKTLHEHLFWQPRMVGKNHRVYTIRRGLLAVKIGKNIFEFEPEIAKDEHWKENKLKWLDNNNERRVHVWYDIDDMRRIAIFDAKTGHSIGYMQTVTKTTESPGDATPAQEKYMWKINAVKQEQYKRQLKKIDTISSHLINSGILTQGGGLSFAKLNKEAHNRACEVVLAQKTMGYIGLAMPSQLPDDNTNDDIYADNLINTVDYYDKMGEAALANLNKI